MVSKYKNDSSKKKTVQLNSELWKWTKILLKDAKMQNNKSVSIIYEPMGKQMLSEKLKIFFEKCERGDAGARRMTRNVEMRLGSWRRAIKSKA